MSHSPKSPPLATATSDLPEVEDGVLAYDTTQGKPVARVAGAWSEIAGEVFGTPTVVYDDGTAVGNTDQIQGDIPNEWKKLYTSLKGLVIGTSCTTIGGSAFSSCSGLTGSLTIPNSVTRIGAGAFSGCTGLTGSLVIPDSVTSIGVQAFTYCPNLTGDLVIPDSVTIIGGGAFNNCSGLTGTLTISNNVTIINNNTFKSCGFNGTLTIPNGVTSIGFQAFGYCSGLTNVDCYVEKSVLDAADSLLSSGVTTIHVRSTDSTWTAGGGQTIGGKTGITVIKDL